MVVIVDYAVENVSGTLDLVLPFLKDPDKSVIEGITEEVLYRLFRSEIFDKLDYEVSVYEGD